MPPTLDFYDNNNNDGNIPSGGLANNTPSRGSLTFYDGPSFETKAPILKSEPSFEEETPLKRALKGPTAALETVVRGTANLTTGAASAAVGAIKGLMEGKDIQGLIDEGQNLAKDFHIDPIQAGSAYFDKKINEGFVFFREKFGEAATSAKKYQDLNKQDLESLKTEAANRGIAESVFDAASMYLFGKTAGGLKGKEIPIVEPIKELTTPAVLKERRQASRPEPRVPTKEELIQEAKEKQPIEP
jgi:hypothetical protein